MTTFAWLIEMTYQGSPIYMWSWDAKTATRSPHEAVRFASKEEAEKFVEQHMGRNDWKVVEHGFEEPGERKAAPSALAVETARKCLTICGLANEGHELAALIEAAIARVRAEERERVIKIVEGYTEEHRLKFEACEPSSFPSRNTLKSWMHKDKMGAGIDIAAAIRGGGDHE